MVPTDEHCATGRRRRNVLKACAVGAKFAMALLAKVAQQTLVSTARRILERLLDDMLD